jgi:hypothetical protein
MPWVLVVLLAGLLVGLPQVTTAQTPAPNVFDGGNRWQVTCHNDPSPTHIQQATQGVCFFPYAVAGKGIVGLWYSDTFPDWNGRYYQEGDQVRMHGDYDANDGHDSFEWDIVSARSGAGHWTEWRETPDPGRTITFCNANWVRVGSCTNTPHPPPAPEHGDLLIKLSQEVPPRCLTNGDIAPDPLARGQGECR